MSYQFDWSAVLDPFMWLEAAGVTVVYALGTITLGMIVGVICGSVLLSRRAWLRAPVRGYVQLFRCTPLLIQIVWFYYALPMVSGINMPAWLAAGLGMSLYMGAFCTEIFRAGVMSIDKGQWDAARALGLPYLPTMRLVVLPQATRRMIPPLVNQSVLQLKNTSLLYVVAVPDLMYASSQLTSRTYRPLEVYTFAALIYFALLCPLTMLSQRLETPRHG